ncbi:hypothetical protein BJ322DRAFT_570944 [Thelephora terrestris]|uniref:Uncharacterized protein n=1 Tax=Thelephora terrestris TaxID=56493 RepID=A0A9P6L149_9AGAM|nr:hypothetical protein BJ322DRAFT_570944 [Thelephora terrestris]
MNLQATHPAFLKRPLKRSFSQTSSSSLHSEASGAPQLPPLHFRPAFTGISIGTIASTSPSTPPPGPPGTTCSNPHPPRVVVSTRLPPSTSTSPQRSQLSHSQPNTPQSLTTPRSHRFGSLDHLHKCSAIYEDSASEKSFVTATSGESGPDPGIIANHDIPSTVDLVIYPDDQERTGEQLENVEGSQRNAQEWPSSSNVVPEQLHTERGNPASEQGIQRIGNHLQRHF